MKVGQFKLLKVVSCGLLAGVLMFSGTGWAEDGVTETEIRVGTVLDLEGMSRRLGRGMLQGMQAAFRFKRLGERKVVLLSANDSYSPSKTLEATHQLIKDGVLLFVGNVGTPTAKVVLPLLEEKKIPALGFFTGAGLLRPNQSTIINFRASYVQEVGAVIQAALSNGVDPATICAYVQNDSYGMAGIEGVQEALHGKPGVEKAMAAFTDILQKEGDNPARNGIGPVGVYQRNSFMARDGYNSLKAWGDKQGKPCRLIVTVGSYESIGRFIAYALSKGEPWIFSAVSFTGAKSLLNTLDMFDVTGKVLMTQVVPALDSTLPIVKEARSALNDDMDQLTLEGYIVGRLLLYGLEQLDSADKAITRENLLAVYQNKTFDLGGLSMDFQGDNQGSDFVEITALMAGKWMPVHRSTWAGWHE